MSTFDIVLLRQRGLSIAEIARKAGIPAKEVSARLKAYDTQNKAYCCHSITCRKPWNKHTDKHPEQRSW